MLTIVHNIISCAVRKKCKMLKFKTSLHVKESIITSLTYLTCVVTKIR